MSAAAQFIVADRGGSAFALPIEKVARVTMSPRICEAPLLPPGFLGVIDFDGGAIAVWDPFPDAGDPMWGATVIVVEGPDGKIGILSDAPPRVAFGEPEVAPAARAGAAKVWVGAVKVDGATIPVIDPKKFGSERQAA